MQLLYQGSKEINNSGGPVNWIRANAFSKSLALWTTVGSVSVKIDPLGI